MILYNLIFIVLGYIIGYIYFKDNNHAPNSNLIKNTVFCKNEIRYQLKPYKI